MKRDRDRCRDCRYFSYRDHIPQEDQRLWGQHLDGWCSKIFGEAEAVQAEESEGMNAAGGAPPPFLTSRKVKHLERRTKWKSPNCS